MNGLDIALLVVLIFFFLRGIFRGFVKEVVGVLALVVAFVIASHYYPALGDALKAFIQNQDYRNTIGFEVVFLVTFFIISLLGLLVDKLISIAIPGWISGLIGACVGVGKGVVLAAVILMAATVFIRQDTPFFKDSLTWPYMKGIVESVRDMTPQSLKDALAERRREIPASLKPKLPDLTEQDESSEAPSWLPVPGKGTPAPAAPAPGRQP